MGVIDDYLNGLEGEEELNPLEVARKMHELHNQEIGTREAKIGELKSTVAEKDSLVSERESEIERWKAKNFDLAMQIPGAVDPSHSSGIADPGDGSFTIDDLFKK